MLLSMSIASFWPRPQEEEQQQRRKNVVVSSSKNKSKSKKKTKEEVTSSLQLPSPVKDEEEEAVTYYSYFYQRYPILSLCIVTTIVGLAIVGYVASQGWEGAQISSNCYQDQLIQADCFCEHIKGNKPGDVWIAQPMNTLTNIWFVIVGFWIASVADSNYQTCLLDIPNWMLLLPPPPSPTTSSSSSSTTSSEIQKKKKRHTKPINLMTSNKIYATALALVSCLLGVGSTALHSSFTNWGRQADMIAMYLLGTYMIIYPLLRSKLILKTTTACWLYLLSNMALIYWVTQLSTPEQARQVFTTLIIISILIEIQIITQWSSPQYLAANKKARRVHMANGIMFALSIVQWKLSSSGGPLCDPDSIWQGHSLWHFTSAIGIGNIFLYYLYEEEEIPGMKKIEEEENKTTDRRNGVQKDESSQPPQVIRLGDKTKPNIRMYSSLDDIPVTDIDSIFGNPVLRSVQFLQGVCGLHHVLWVRQQESSNDDNVGHDNTTTSYYEQSNCNSIDDTRGTEEEEKDDDVWSESSSSDN